MADMTIKDVTGHDVAGKRIEDTLERRVHRAFGHWADMRHHGIRPLRQGLREMRGDVWT
jgi:hypothetical protein